MTPELDPSTDPLVRSSVQDVRGLLSFDAAAVAVLEHLSTSFGLALWMITRTAGDDFVVLHATDSSYGVRSGDVLRWSDSLCSRMVRGQGPRVSPRTADVPVYRTAPAARVHPIGSYVGIPLTGPDGELFGTLCAFDPEPSADTLAQAQPLLELQGRLLSGILAVELRSVRSQRASDAAQEALSGQVLDPSRWSGLLLAEQARSARHATPTSVISLVVDDAHDSSCADATAQRVLLDRRRAGDALARTGPGSYVVLCPETLEPVAQTVATDLVLRLLDAGVVASCGVAATDPSDRDLVAAWRRAEHLQRDEQLGAGADGRPLARA